MAYKSVKVLTLLGLTANDQTTKFTIALEPKGAKIW